MHIGIIKINCDNKKKLRLTIPSHKIKIVRGPYLGFRGPLFPGNQRPRGIWSANSVTGPCMRSKNFVATTHLMTKTIRPVSNFLLFFHIKAINKYVIIRNNYLSFNTIILIEILNNSSCQQSRKFYNFIFMSLKQEISQI